MKKLFTLHLSLMILLSACKKSINSIESTSTNNTGANIITGPTVDITTRPIST
ncbi:MAG: hypothetical protein NTZ27_12195 [Ignavibacteriales bacterium]|nr:hypothetical protein [Ignavibacteriales bacterium]